MAETLQTHNPATVPRGCDEHRHSKAEPQRISANRLRRLVLAVLFQLHILERRVKPLRGAPRFRALRMGSLKRRDVIEIAVVLVVGQDENRVLPDFGGVGAAGRELPPRPLAVPSRPRVSPEAYPRGQQP